jgi:hypothetical protein
LSTPVADDFGQENETMDKRKVISDVIIASQDTIFTLQAWLNLLEMWQSLGRAEPDDFWEVYQQLIDANLQSWMGLVGGHGIEALAGAVGVSTETPGGNPFGSELWPTFGNRMLKEEFPE